MSAASPDARLSPPFDPERDHVSGAGEGSVTLVEFGDYECPYCGRAHRGIMRLRDERLPGRLRYVFRHLPNSRIHPHAALVAEAAEAAGAQGKFWEMHDYLLTHQNALDRTGLVDGALALGLDVGRFTDDLDSHRFADRVREDLDSAERSGARATPTLFVDGQRYDGPWDGESILEAICKPLGWRLRFLARQFAGLSISSGLLMLLGVVLALISANSPWRDGYLRLWNTMVGVHLGPLVLTLSLARWVNDGLIVIFFFVVALEIRHELTDGDLRTPRQAALPIVAAVSGMLMPALIYLAFNAGHPAAHGWGIPMGTDTALALGLLATLGSRVPVSLRVFVAAAAIVDDIGSLLVIAIFYSDRIVVGRLLLALGLVLLAFALNRSRVYRTLPYAVIGVLVWLSVLGSGVHPTIAGVLMAFVIPSRARPNPGALLEQSESLLESIEAPAIGDPTPAAYDAAVRQLEEMADRLLSPAQRLARDIQPWSAYVVLPLFALANAGLSLDIPVRALGHRVALGIGLGLLVGKPLGLFSGAWLATRAGLAAKPDDTGWRQLIGVAFVCGIGFTMAYFVADVTFRDPPTLAVAKTSVLAASVAAGIAGWLILRVGRGAGSSGRAAVTSGTGA